MLLSAVSVLVVAQSSSEIPEGLMNNPVYSRQTSGRINFYNRPRMSFITKRIDLLYKEGRVNTCALSDRRRVVGWVLCVNWQE